MGMFDALSPNDPLIRTLTTYPPRFSNFGSKENADLNISGTGV